VAHHTAAAAAAAALLMAATMAATATQAVPALAHRRGGKWRMPCSFPPVDDQAISFSAWLFRFPFLYFDLSALSKSARVLKSNEQAELFMGCSLPRRH